MPRWGPLYIMLITFFFGFVTGAILFWLNARRLGMPQRTGLIVGLTIAYLGLFIVAAAYTPPQTRERARAPESQEIRELIERLDKIKIDVPNQPLGTPSADAPEVAEGDTTPELEQTDKPATEKPAMAAAEPQAKERKSSNRLLRHGMKIVALLCGAVFYVGQKKRYRIAEGHGIDDGKLLGPGILACVIGFFVTLATEPLWLLVRGIYFSQ